MGQIHEGRFAAGEKSLSKAPPTCIASSQSSIALETRAVRSLQLDLGGSKWLRMRSRRVLVGLTFKVS